MKYIIDIDDIEKGFDEQIQKATHNSAKNFYETIKLTIIEYINEVGVKIEETNDG